MKLWWVHCEALIATLLAYKTTGKDKYWDLFKKTMHYSSTHVNNLLISTIMLYLKDRTIVSNLK